MLRFATRAVLISLALLLGVGLVPPEAVVAITASQTLNTTSLKPLPGNTDPLSTATDVTAPGLHGGMGSPDATKSKQRKPFLRMREDETKRTTHSAEFINSDGSRTLQLSPGAPINYQADGVWSKIEPQSQKDAGYQPQLSLDDTPSDQKSNAINLSAGRLQAKLKPFKEGIELRIGGKDLTITPQSARNVRPELVSQSGSSYVIYRDVWDGVDVVYETVGESLKETIVINKQGTRTDFSFGVSGAALSRHPIVDGAFAIEGLDPAEYGIAPLSVNVQGRGLIDEPVAKQTVNGAVITIALDAAWLGQQPASSFPIAIDPTFQNGITDGFASYKSNGFSCSNGSCAGLSTGAVGDNGWKYWRSMARIPYEGLQGKVLRGAQLQMVMASRPYYTGTTSAQNMYASWAPCLGYNNCTAGTVSTMSLTQGGWMDLTPTMKWMQDNNIWGGWIAMWGSEGNWESYKLLEPALSNIYIDYTYPPPMAQPASPAQDAVVTTTQPMLQSTPVTDPNGDEIQYLFRIATSPDGGGAIAQSGWSTSQQWTVPEGVLQDGTTYYWQTFTTTGWATTTPNWTRAIKVDMRTGKDATQSYDTVGPLSTNLATGNLTTGNASHMASALGGSLGVGLEYNSPQVSRPGLIGEYWNVSSGGNPSGPANLTRTDAQVDFTWALGPPAKDIVNPDWFHAKWTGYFVAPIAGNYQFGGSNDDTMRVKINGQEVYNNAGCYASQCYGGTVTLQAGQVVPIEVYYIEATQTAHAKLYVKGAVVEQVVPSAWLQTGVRPVGVKHGLTGRYYRDSGNHQIPTNQNEAFMARTDPTLSFTWGEGAPIGGGPTDQFMVRWSGYFIAPQTGDYFFGTFADDGVRITANNQQVLDYWTCCSDDRFGSSVSLTAGQIIPITVDYFEANGPAHFHLLVKGAVTQQVVPSAWLLAGIPSLPTGWNLIADPDGNLSYDRLRAGSNNAVLTDTSGQTHEYKWQDGGYKPPANENGYLVRNEDGTFTLQDTDGRTYVFNTDGTLQSSVTPLDDRKPAALRYEYSGSPSRLVKIIDGVTTNRFVTLYYSGDSACGSPPAGFTAAPGGMLCAVKTHDGTTTKFLYKNGLLSRVEKPGGAITDYSYDSLSRITSVRDSLAADAIAAGLRTDDATATTEVAYDTIGRVSSITQPAPTAGAGRLSHSYQYLAGATQKHISGAAEPNGFSQRVEYDGAYRTTRVTDAANLSTTTEWLAAKDIVMSTTDPTGLKSTTIIDLADRPWQSYGPAPAAWYGSNNAPLPAYVNQVPRTDTLYDQNITGPAVSYYHYRSSPEAPKGGTLMGAPKQFATGYNPTTPGNLDNAWASDPLAPETGASGWGMTQTGVMNMQTSGTYSLAIHHTEGARLYLDDQLVINDWNDGTYRSTAIHTFNYTAGQKPIRWRVDFYSKYGTPSPALRVYVAKQGGFSWTSDWSSFLTPNYGLATTTTSYDATLGNVEAKTSYGTRPELGLAQTSTLDPTGLNYANTSGYEAPGSGFLRQTSRALPGGTTTNYSYYSATETADNPCTAPADAVHQGGMLKTKTEADPDAGGSQTSRTSRTVYDTLGRPVASRYNSDAWTCTSYDARGRVTQTIQPVVNSRAGRTVTTTFNYQGSPFKTQVTDTVIGSAVSEIDLLGRKTTSIDTFGNTYPITYDALGRVTTQGSPLGTESYDYDNLNRNTTYKLDNVTYATITYDAYSRVQGVNYPQAKDGANNTLKLEQIKRDSLLRTNGAVFRFSNGQAYDETLSKSVNGRVTASTDAFDANSVANTYSYDKAGRLTEAVVDKNKYTYGYGAPSAATCNQTAANLNAHKNSNRTSFTVTNTVNSQVTSQASYCYNKADRLLTSTDTQIGTPTYDDHGNTTTLAGAGTPIQFTYDASDANTAVTQGANKVEYTKTASGTVLRKKEYLNNTLTKSYRYVAGSTVLQTCSLTDDNNCATTDKYLSLPGGVLLTLSPANPVPAQQTVYSIKNFHGDTAMTASATGTPTSSVFLYEPFGQPSTSVTFATNSNPANATNAPIAWAANPTRKQETLFSLPIIQMGARVYLPSLGRFAQVDPVEGGTLNAYVYAVDPVNANDYSGQFVIAIPWLVQAAVAAGAAAAATYTVMTNPNVKSAGVAVFRGVGDLIAQGFRSVPQAAATPPNRPNCRPRDKTNTYDKLNRDFQMIATNSYQFNAMNNLQKGLNRGTPLGERVSLTVNDPNYKDGFSKYRASYVAPDGSKITLHYIYNEDTCEYGQIKIK